MSLDHLTEQVVTVVLDAFRPVTAAVASEAALHQLVEALGWRVPEGAGAGSTGLEPLAEVVGAVQSSFDAWSAGNKDPGALLDVLQAATALFDLLHGLQTPGSAPAPINRPEFWSSLVSDLPAYLFATWLRRESPLINALLVLTGIVDTESTAPDDDRFEGFRRTVVRWDRLSTLIKDPRELIAQVYGWGGTLDADRLLRALEQVLEGCGLPAMRCHPDLNVVEEHYGAGATVPEGVARLRVPLLVARADDGTASQVEVGVEVFPVPSAPGSSDPRGLLVGPYGTAALTATFPFTEDTALTFQGTGEVGGMGLVLLPGETRFVPGAAGAVGGVLGLELQHVPASPRVLLGDATGTGVSLATLTLGLEARLSGLAIEEVVGRLAIGKLRLAVDFGEGDGFLASITDGLKGAVEVDLQLEWSSVHGLRLSGSGGLEIVLALDLALGPLQVSSITLRAGAAEGGGIRLDAGVTASLEVGPVLVAVDTVGVRATFLPDASGPVFGLSPRFGFLPPRGAGLSIDAGPVSGGGFLSLDFEKQQYAGILQLSIQKVVDVKAIGILNARLPDGRPGYSLLLIITGEFPPIQLGLGFTLNGVGGLIAINRTVVVDVLRAGVRDGGLDAILFPPDPLSHVASLLGTLSAVFPVAENRYVFGPMVRIGWGSPTLITLDLALILEIPDPVRLIILGRLKAVLPNEKAPVVQLRLDALGVLDFSRNEFSLDATLYDSRIVAFALTGDMALRLSWGSQPAFAMALGGFHPAFKPPPGFPALRRLALALSTGDNPRLRMETYFALTSNTVQVGARLELYVKIAAFSLEGGLGFDTLIQFSPFRLLADIDAHLALKRGSTTLMGLDINVHLMGPAPWVLWGQAKFKIFFVSFSIPFRETFGQSQDVPPIERREVWPVLRDNLTATASWSAQLPGDGGRLVALRAGTGGDDLLVHPLGTLAVSQNLVPLDRTLGLFGAVPPKDFDRFAIIAATGLDITDTTTQYFAPAQFRQMTDAEKLASPSFERMVSGARFAPHTATAIGHVQDTPLDYEQAVILDVDQPASERLDQRYAPAGATVAVLAEHGPAGTAAVRTQGRAKFAPPAPGPKVADPSFVIVTRDDLTPVAVDGLDGSYTSAAERLRQRADRDALQIVRAEELELT